MGDNQGEMFVYYEQLRGGLTPDEKQQILEAASRDFIELGIEARVELTGDGSYAVAFNSEAEFHLMAEEMSRTHPEYDTAHHVELFDNRTSNFEKAWVEYASRQLRDTGMSFQVDHEIGRSATFFFPSYASRLMFSKVVETGWITRAAELISHNASEGFDNNYGSPNPNA